MADQEFKDRVQDVLRNQVAPMLSLDAEFIEVTEVDNGIASVRLAGACASCPATLMTMITQMEYELRQHIPEIEVIEAVP